jgi:hypothetical protein
MGNKQQSLLNEARQAGKKNANEDDADEGLRSKSKK